MVDKKRQAKAIRRIQLALVWLVPIIFLVVIFQNQVKVSLTASEIINFNQEIYATNPVQSAGQLEPLKKEVDTKSEQFSIIQPINIGQQSITSLGNVTSSLFTFQGQITYPNTDILLEFSPHPFFVSLVSDEFGRWTWTNYGQPFDPTMHLLNVYSFVPTGEQDLREVFVEQYSFNVIGNEDVDPVVLFLDQGGAPCTSDQDCLNGRLDLDSETNMYLFTVAMQNNQISYAPGQAVGVELYFSPLIERQVNELSVQYEIYSLGINSSPIVTFNDNFILGDQYSFLKKFDLSSEAAPGTYLVKIVAKSAGDIYISSINFQIVEPYLQAFGGVVLSEQDFNSAMLWNIIFVLVIFSGILVVAGLEFRRFYVYRAIDEEVLRSKGYFKN